MTRLAGVPESRLGRDGAHPRFGAGATVTVAGDRESNRDNAIPRITSGDQFPHQSLRAERSFRRPGAEVCDAELGLARLARFAAEPRPAVSSLTFRGAMDVPAGCPLRLHGSIVALAPTHTTEAFAAQGDLCRGSLLDLTRYVLYKLGWAFKSHVL